MRIKQVLAPIWAILIFSMAINANAERRSRPADTVLTGLEKPLPQSTSADSCTSNDDGTVSCDICLEHWDWGISFCFRGTWVPKDPQNP